jgi:hypothetical protein
VPVVVLLHSRPAVPVRHGRSVGASATAESPDLIEYACERCEKLFQPPAVRLRLGIGGWRRALALALGGRFGDREGRRATTHRQLLAKINDDAFGAFVGSFKLCHECRQFVCARCWSKSRRTCRTCAGGPARMG